MTDRQPLQPVPGLARTARIMAPKARPVPEPSATPAPFTPEPTVTPAETSRVPKRPARDQAAAKVDHSTRPRDIALSLPSSLVEALRKRAIRDAISQADVLLDALSATRDQLPELVAPVQHEATQAEGDLFVRTSRPRESAPRATLTLRLAPKNVSAIDQLVVESASPSRSRMCAAALGAYLA